MTNRHIASALVGLFVSASLAFAQAAPDKGASPEPSQEQLEKQFAETLSGATLVGQFTITGLNDDKPLAKDKYTLGTVKKLKNGFWSFEARIQYGNHDVKLPLALPVKWAGDTPVISVTSVAFPGLGTYSARVVIYGDQYAGTWSGSDHGGQMFGRIVKAGEQVPADK
ncbi:MAG: hypothetical protein WD063_04960 [Pirellulales bacterium]